MTEVTVPCPYTQEYRLCDDEPVCDDGTVTFDIHEATEGDPAVVYGTRTVLEVWGVSRSCKCLLTIEQERTLQDQACDNYRERNDNWR